MRANQDVHLLFSRQADDLILGFVRPEAGEHLNGDREDGEALAEGFVVLLRENSGWHQHRHLFAICHRFEGGAQSHFGFAISHIAAEQPVHRTFGFHVGFDLLDGKQLIRGFNVRKRGFQFFLPVVVRFKGISLSGLALGVELKQILRHFHHGMSNTAFGQIPIGAAKTAEAGRTTFGSNVAGDAVRLVNWHVEDVVIFIRNRKIFALNTIDIWGVEPDELADAVIHVNHPVSRFQVRVDRLRNIGVEHGAPAGLRAAPAENFTIGKQVLLDCTLL